MSLIQTIDDQMKSALKGGEKERLSALRNIKSYLKNKAIDARRDLNPQEITQSLSTLAKQRRESIDAYEKAGRNDLVEKEKNELSIIEGFLPKPLTDEELGEMIKQAIADTQASGPKDMGLVMKALKDQVTGRADGKVVSEKVKQALAGS